MGRVFKKRKNVGKPKLVLIETEEIPSTSNCDLRTPEADSPRTATTLPTKSSLSKTKLDKNKAVYDSKLTTNSVELDVICVEDLQVQLENIASCRFCQHNLTFEKKQLTGLAMKLNIFCPNCENKTVYSNSKTVQTNEGNESKTHKLYDINLRLVLALRSLGLGFAGAEMLCGVMNLHSPPDNYYLYEKHLGIISEKVSSKSMQRAVDEAIEMNDGSRDLCVAVDGSWQRRGHVSLNGVLSVTSVDVGKVIDVAVLSKFCKCPGRLNNDHLVSCIANYSGTSGGMEVAGALQVFGRSEALYNARYTEYLGDGDSNGFKAVCEAKPYGEIEILKKECIGHVQKRMFSRLKSAKTKSGIYKDKNSKKRTFTLNLTEGQMKQIQLYYGLAIRRNTDSVNAMWKGIWAEYFHLCSTNEKPMHAACPKDENTWCKYQQAKIKNQEYDHNEHFHIPEATMLEIKQIFRDLSSNDLLEKCVNGKTQNPNESFNNIIWSLVPKKTFVSLETLKFGVFQAVLRFNDGYLGLIWTLEQAGLEPGKNCIASMKKRDERRIRRSEKKQKDLEKKVRQKRELAKRKLEDQYLAEEDPENPAYCSGLY